MWKRILPVCLYEGFHVAREERLSPLVDKSQCCCLGFGPEVTCWARWDDRRAEERFGCIRAHPPTLRTMSASWPLNLLCVRERLKERGDIAVGAFPETCTHLSLWKKHIREGSSVYLQPFTHFLCCNPFISHLFIVLTLSCRLLSPKCSLSGVAYIYTTISRWWSGVWVGVGFIFFFFCTCLAKQCSLVIWPIRGEWQYDNDRPPSATTTGRRRWGCGQACFKEFHTDPEPSPLVLFILLAYFSSSSCYFLVIMPQTHFFPHCIFLTGLLWPQRMLFDWLFTLEANWGLCNDASNNKLWSLITASNKTSDIDINPCCKY